MGRKRPRGFTAKWSPEPHTVELLRKVQAILDEYADYLPVTLRQVFYRLVARYGFEKDEKAYGRMQEAMTKARRARVIPFDAFRDDGYHITSPWWFDDVDDFRATVTNSATNFQLDRQRGQDRRLLVWCEAAGMVPQLERVAMPYGIRVASSGGFDGVTLKHDIGRALAQEPTTVLYVGDYDPSGVHMYGSLDEDVRAFADAYGGGVEFVRLAVLPEHIELYGLPTAPPKTTDKREFNDVRTVQAESLDPATLAQIVEEGITSRLDVAMYHAAMDREEALRDELRERLELAGLWAGEYA